jgi:hypothetical protein
MSLMVRFSSSVAFVRVPFGRPAPGRRPPHVFTFKELVGAAYPSATNELPVKKGYFYSNTGARGRGEVEGERGWRASQRSTLGCLWLP